MKVGVCRVVLRLPQNHSLKGKRRILHSVTNRLRSRFKVSVAEVEDNDVWHWAVLGISCVSNDSRHANEVLSQIVGFLQSAEGEYEVTDYQVEIVTEL